jgi:hypothetical protein
MNTHFNQYQQEHAHILTFFKFYDMNELWNRIKLTWRVKID